MTFEALYKVENLIFYSFKTHMLILDFSKKQDIFFLFQTLSLHSFGQDHLCTRLGKCILSWFNIFYAWNMVYIMLVMLVKSEKVTMCKTICVC